MINLQILVLLLETAEPKRSEPTELTISKRIILEKFYLIDLYYNLITKKEKRKKEKQWKRDRRS